MEPETRVDSSEKDLIHQIREGSYHLFEQLITAYQHRLGAFIYRLVDEEDEVKDLVQETFIRAYQSLKSFKGRAAFSTWLFRIGFNLGIDYRKKRKKAESLAEAFIRRDNPDSQNDPRILEEKQLHVLINGIIAGLPEKYRTVLHLFYRETRNYSDIALIMNSPLNTVKSLLYRGKQMVREELERKSGLKV